MIPYLIAGFLGLSGLFVWALLRMAALSDEALERERKERR